MSIQWLLPIFYPKALRGSQTYKFKILGPRYQDREGGYTRVMKLLHTRADVNAPMVVIDIVDRPGEICAARPPLKCLSEVLKKVGIEPIIVQQADTPSTTN
uniref:Uncharacterized protein n=1 Tax=Eucampia antarctica TaxID=49252 RepID=A0A7S2WQW5_9STRA|mmetsp:Transcript_8729/g.8297  ORF Transcript_8729/g.8297 Transcript_8729/m.8297 type:complete len:101 (+) Transcript_8729:164-466(+)